MSNYENRLETNNTNLTDISTVIENLPDRLDTSDATAVSEDIVQGKTAYVNGQKITGTRQILPYIELEYLQSTGTQYLETDIKLTANLRIEMSYKLDSLKNGQCVLCENYNSDHSWFYYGSGLNAVTNRAGVSYDHENVLTVTAINDKVDLIIDNTMFSYNNTITTKNNILNNHNANILIFKHSYYSDKASGKIYYFKVYDNDDLVMSLIPVKRKLDGIVCMYDLITKTYLMNAGTGTFVGGEPKI